MAGAIVIVVVLLLIPVLVLLSGGLAAAVLGEVWRATPNTAMAQLAAPSYSTTEG